MERVRIERRFCGPPTSGNGGYVAGLVARALGSSHCVVTLKRPPPLERELRLATDGSEATLLDGESVVAVAHREPLEIEVPRPPPLDAAAEAGKRFTGLAEHIFPTCFVCGPARAEGDGLRIFAGATEGADGAVAGIWRPDRSLEDEGGSLRPEFVWAALDCPGYFAVQERAGMALLGRLGVVLFEPAITRGPMIVTGWPIGSSGRKHLAGTALHDAGGRLLAAGAATWISLR